MADDAEAKSILVATTIEAAGSKLRKLKSVPVQDQPLEAMSVRSCECFGRGSDGESGSEEPAHRLPAAARGCRRAARRVCSEHRQTLVAA